VRLAAAFLAGYLTCSALSVAWSMIHAWEEPMD
jgi:hypothetical protein